MSAGSFGWLELISPDLAAAQSFYTRLLGWELRTEDMNGEPYTFAVANGANVAGFDTTDGSDTAPHWLPYIQVPGELDESVAKVQSGGGVVFRTLELPGDARFATCADPDGAIFCPLQELKPTESKPDNWPPALGTVSWYAHMSRNAADSARFYSDVFGYDAEASDMMNTPEGYTVLKVGEEMHAGLLSHNGTLPSCWLVYFVVADVEAAQRKAVELGGTISTPVMTIPEIGRIVSAVDPQGAAFCLHQSE